MSRWWEGVTRDGHLGSGGPITAVVFEINLPGLLEAITRVRSQRDVLAKVLKVY